MSHLFIVTELSVFRLCLSAFLGRRILILEIEPFLPMTKGGLNGLVALLIRANKAVWAIDTVPELRRVKEFPRRTLLYNVLGIIEPWQNKYFETTEGDGGKGDYVMANKQAISNYVEGKHVALLVLREIFKQPKDGAFQCIGFPADTFAAGEFFCGRSLPGTPARIPSRLVNAIQFSVGLSISLWWMISHFRLGNAEPENFFFAADFIGDKRDLFLYRELEDGGNMLLVARRPGLASPLAGELSGFTFCGNADGFLGLKDLFPMLKMIVRDEWRVLRRFNKVNPPLFRRFTALPHRRLLYRGLFKRFRPKIFWGRDQYNEDHIIRRQELNAVGGQSWGVNTGTLNWTILIPSNHYVSYDRYFVFGRGKYKKYYGHTWAQDMELVPSGTFSAERAYYARRFDQRPKDIAVFAGAFIGEPEMVHLVRGLAEAFLDRKIILQVKPRFKPFSWAEEFIAECQKGLENVEYTEDSVYEIFLNTRYGISDPSSVVVEAMQFGMISFAFDLPHVQIATVDREYPGLVVESAEQAIGRIRAIEAGEWRYPIEEYGDVVDMSGMVFFDRVRHDMGLPPKEPSVPLLAGDSPKLTVMDND